MAPLTERFGVWTKGAIPEGVALLCGTPDELLHLHGSSVACERLFLTGSTCHRMSCSVALTSRRTRVDERRTSEHRATEVTATRARSRPAPTEAVPEGELRALVAPGDRPRAFGAP